MSEVLSLHRLVFEAHCVMEPIEGGFGLLCGLPPHDVIQ
jgi:hypothetical protein